MRCRTRHQPSHKRAARPLERVTQALAPHRERDIGRQRRCENITGVGINHKVQLSPRAALGWTGTWDVAAVNAETRAVDHNVNGPCVRGYR